MKVSSSTDVRLAIMPLATALKNWVIEMEGKTVRLSVGLIKTKAHDFVQSLSCGMDFKFLNGWYESFAKRNGFKGFTIHGESRDAQMEGTEERIAELKAKIVSYALENVYNMDKTADLYNSAPDKTIA